jgi:hypothetical protein
MKNLLIMVTAATPSPTTDPANTFFSPGTVGFLFTFLVVVGTIALIFDMTRRVRRVRYRAEIQEKLEAERLAAAEQPSQVAKPTAEQPSQVAKPTAEQPSQVAQPAPVAKKAAPAAKAKPERPAPPARPKRG